MLMLYDLLKREAKKQGLQKFEGFSSDVLADLGKLSKMSSERLMHALLKRMLDNNDTERTDIIARAKSMMSGMKNHYILYNNKIFYKNSTLLHT